MMMRLEKGYLLMRSFRPRLSMDPSAVDTHPLSGSRTWECREKPIDDVKLCLDLELSLFLPLAPILVCGEAREELRQTQDHVDDGRTCR